MVGREYVVLVEEGSTSVWTRLMMFRVVTEQRRNCGRYSMKRIYGVKENEGERVLETTRRV
jgi:hypothetical protein